MIVVQLQKSEAYQSLYALSGYSVNDSLIITDSTVGGQIADEHTGWPLVHTTGDSPI